MPTNSRAERRASPRRPTRLFFNRYHEGHPFLGEAIEISASGLLGRRMLAPASLGETCLLELAVPGELELLHLWARRVATRGDAEAFEFLAPARRERRALQRLLSDAG